MLGLLWYVELVDGVKDMDGKWFCGNDWCGVASERDAKLLWTDEPP